MHVTIRRASRLQNSDYSFLFFRLSLHTMRPYSVLHVLVSLLLMAANGIISTAEVVVAANVRVSVEDFAGLEAALLNTSVGLIDLPTNLVTPDTGGDAIVVAGRKVVLMSSAKGTVWDQRGAAGVASIVVAAGAELHAVGITFVGCAPLPRSCGADDAASTSSASCDEDDFRFSSVQPSVFRPLAGALVAVANSQAVCLTQVIIIAGLPYPAFFCSQIRLLNFRSPC